MYTKLNVFIVPNIFYAISSLTHGSNIWTWIIEYITYQSGDFGILLSKTLCTYYGIPEFKISVPEYF